MAQLPPSDKIDENELRQRLGDLAYDVLRNQGTERPFSSELSAHFEKGHYYCAACGHHLFASDQKFDAGCGWPSFMTPVSDDALTTHKDTSHGMVRLRCAAPIAARTRDMFLTMVPGPLASATVLMASP